MNGDLTKLLDDWWKSLEQSVPYFDVVVFNQGLYQISLVSCKAIWSRNPTEVEIVQKYVRSRVESLRSVERVRQEEKIAREMLSGELEVISRILEKAYHEILGQAKLSENSNLGSPSNPYNLQNPSVFSRSAELQETFRYIEDFVVKMIQTRDPSEACKIQEKINQMVADAYRAEESERFRKLCAYSNALLYFKSAVILRPL